MYIKKKKKRTKTWDKVGKDGKVFMARFDLLPATELV